MLMSYMQRPPREKTYCIHLVMNLVFKTGLYIVLRAQLVGVDEYCYTWCCESGL